MQSVIQFFAAKNIDIAFLLKVGLPILIGMILLSVIGRFAFGKRSVLNNALSSAVGILFIYAVTVAVYRFYPSLMGFLSPLPFISITGDQMHIFPLTTAHYLTISGEILRMLILAFLVNLIDQWLPKGKNVFTWFFFRASTVVSAILVHLIVTGIIQKLLPQGLLLYAPVILLGILVLMLLTGALKILVGAVLTTVNPLIAALYTFFFANIVGKQITKAVLTTGVLSIIVVILNKAGIESVSIAAEALPAYLPFIVLLLPVWFLIYKVI